MKLPVHTEINDDGMGLPMYQVRDADDNLICTSYTSDNYKNIVRAVNREAKYREALDAARRGLLEAHNVGGTYEGLTEINSALAEEETTDAE